MGRSWGDRQDGVKANDILNLSQLKIMERGSSGWRWDAATPCSSAREQGESLVGLNRTKDDTLLLAMATFPFLQGKKGTASLLPASVIWNKLGCAWKLLLPLTTLIYHWCEEEERLQFQNLKIPAPQLSPSLELIIIIIIIRTSMVYTARNQCEVWITAVS